MVDRDARRRAAEAIRHYVCGVITNREFERRYPLSKRDPVIGALDDTLWAIYEDISTHRLVGENAVTELLKARVARWLVSLYSEAEYQWPHVGNPGLRDLPAEDWLGNFLRRFFRFPERSARFMARGAYDVWPFLRRQDLEDALRKPVLLGGGF